MNRPDGKSERRRREMLGRRAEAFAAIWLQLKGYSILDRRVRFKVGELDIVARRGNVVVFVEVKARQTRDAGLGAVTDRSWVRIARAASQWMSRRRDQEGADWRYDLMVVTPNAMPLHMRDHWRPETGDAD